MSQPDIFLFIGDCLRSASVGTPRFHQRSDLIFSKAYSPGTWTLPSHASLFSQQSVPEHNVTRPGNSITPEQAYLPRIANKNGYQTALFSENPQFSSQTGFHNGIDYVDDSIHRKLLPSQFSAINYADDIDLRSAVSVLTEILRRPDRARNLINTAYGFGCEIRDSSSIQFPHHGKRVLAHQDKFIRSETNKPTFVTTNLLEPHNPHYYPPEAGAADISLDISKSEAQALRSVADNQRYLLTKPEIFSERARSWYDSWESIFNRRKEIFDAHIRELDIIVDDWINSLPSKQRRESLIILTGDHGHLFGEEGMVGHQTSLHPHGIHVPLLVKFPESWKPATQKIETPVSLIGLSKAIEGVITGSIKEPKAFASTVIDESKNERGQIVTFTDGPTWSISDLRGKYSNKSVDKLAVRKVGVVKQDEMDIYQCYWDESEVTKLTYSLHDGTRSFLHKESADNTEVPHGEWLTSRGEDGEIPSAVKGRLEQLGYR